MSAATSMRSEVTVALLAGVAAIGCFVLLLTPLSEGPERTTTTRHGLTSLPLAAQGPVSAALGQDGPAYRVKGLRAGNPAQHLRAGFSRHGVTVASGKARLGMALSAYGYGSTLRLGWTSAVPRASANRVSYAHGALTEWYANGPLGIEQGFDVAARPGAAAGPLTLSLALSGNLVRAAAGRLGAAHGPRAPRFATAAWSQPTRAGDVLRSWLQLAKGHVLIRVADRGAAYPLRIDPMIQQGEKLTGTGAVGHRPVRLQRGALRRRQHGADRRALRHQRRPGAAWVFTRSGATWTQQGGKLVGTGHIGEGEFAHVGEGEFGASVALSGDGNTALIGGPGDDSGKGAAWVFTRSGSTWTQQGAKLTGTGETGEGRFG